MKIITWKPKSILGSLLKESQLITGKDLIKRREERCKELALFEEALEFEKSHRKSKGVLKLK